MKRVLAIESSCDETGVGLVSFESDESHRLDRSEDALPILQAHALHSQIDLHQAYGGVVPELASRDHVRRVVPLIRQVLQKTNVSLSQIDYFACTTGPGLAGALLVGAGTAAALAFALKKPLISVHHLEGHLLSPFLSKPAPAFPFVALLVSGGHTQLMQVEKVGRYELLGETIDDAAGEAFDKSAKLMGLDYPGGPQLAQWAAQGDPDRYALPRPLMHAKSLDFSFAGLKTAVRTKVEQLGWQLTDAQRADLAASTQAAIVDVLAVKAIAALRTTRCRTLVVSGGVGANLALRTRLNSECQKLNAALYFPDIHLCTDNGAMIALAAAMRLQAKVAHCMEPGRFEVTPRWPLSL